MEPSSEAREAILGALPDAVRAFPGGGLASLVLERDGRVLDAAVRLRADGAPEVWLRPLPTADPAALETWMGLLERCRGQLAHELSGPATGVLAALETVLEYEPIPASSRELLADARAGMMRLNRLLDHRVGTFSGRPSLVEGPLDRLVEQWTALSCHRFDPRGERLAVEVRADPAAVRCDANLAQAALDVLLNNAWKFRRGQRVHARVEAERRDGALRLGVTDDGRGIDRDTLRRAGELGYSSRASGVGLGLFRLRWAARGAGGALLIHPAEGGARVSLFVPANTAEGGGRGEP
jgi:signal transduction histidine kinase